MITPRCSAHKDRAEAPRLCHICQRIAVEQDIVTRTVDALLAAGYDLQINDGDEFRPELPTTNRAVILEELMEVDDEYLFVYGHAHRRKDNGWVRFVYGNDGYDVINDYTVNLESVLAPVNQYANSLET